MKSPLWIINSLLVVILLAILAFIIYSFKNIVVRPQTAPIKVGPLPETSKREEAKPKEARLIYEENDLFGTYRPTFIPEKPIETLPMIPRPPAPKPIISKPRPFIQFLEPLPVRITGIIASSNEAKSQVSIINNNTRRTESFRVGDKLLDAYILRILPRKIVIIRSNGQQETLFMYPQDAQQEIKNIQESSWADVIQQQNEHRFLLNPTAFASRIQSLAHLIDMLDLTIAAKNDKNIGVRIGRMDDKSIGYAAGFIPGDIVLKIQNIAPISTTTRMQIYNALASLKLGSDVKVQFMRHGQIITNNYTFFNLADMTASFENLPVAPTVMPSMPIPSLPRTPEVRELEAHLPPVPSHAAVPPHGITPSMPTELAVPGGHPFVMPAEGAPPAAMTAVPVHVRTAEEPAHSATAPQLNQAGEKMGEIPRANSRPQPTHGSLSATSEAKNGTARPAATQAQPRAIQADQSSSAPSAQPPAEKIAMIDPVKRRKDLLLDRKSYQSPIQQMKKRNYEGMKQFGAKTAKISDKGHSSIATT